MAGGNYRKKNSVTAICEARSLGDAPCPEPQLHVTWESRLSIVSHVQLQRTAPWLDKHEGGIEAIRSIVIDDKLGIAAELEARMGFLVETYQCEWKQVVEDPERRATFEQFVNAPGLKEDGIEFMTEREQRRPVDWPGLGGDGTLPGACSSRPPLTHARFVQPLGK